MAASEPSLPTVLQVLPALETGGVERGTVEMTQAIVAAGGRAVVASAGGRMVAEVTAAGGRHVTLPLASKRPWTMLANVGRLRRLIREKGVGLVHARSRAPAWSAWLAARREGVAFVTTCHGVYSEGGPGKRLYNSVMARGDRVIAISRHVGERVAARHGVGADRLRVIPRGVDPARFHPDAVDAVRLAALRAGWALPPGRAVIMLPARLTRWKGAAVLIEALPHLVDRDAIAVLVGPLAGRARFAGAVRALAASRGVGDRVFLVGGTEDMPAALALADVVVTPSLKPEPFGRTVIEAQAMRRPVIAADHGGAVETVSPGETGFRVAPGDAAALAEAIDLVLAMPDGERAALGARSRAAVLRDHTTAAMQAATLAVYRELSG